MTHCVRDEWEYLNKMERAYQLIALQLDPNRRDGGKMEDRRGRRKGRRGNARQGRKKEARQSGRRKRGDARQGGGRKRGSDPRTKLKSRGCNSSDLKTILYILTEGH